MVNTQTPTLWVFGDSFSEIDLDDPNSNIWSVSLANKLQYNLCNDSLAGSAQDWSFSMVKKYKSHITPLDQIIIALTHSSRFWFFEDLPSVANSNIIDFEDIVGSKERVLAAEYYIKHIQRPSLDFLMLDHRLGWLNNLVLINKWKKPIIILGFGQYYDPAEYPDLIFSTGNLYDVSVGEGDNALENRGVDIRYNHLCISNHTILSEKLFNTIVKNEPLDLTTGFKKNIFSKDMLENDTEVSKIKVQRYNDRGSPAGKAWGHRIFKK